MRGHAAAQAAQPARRARRSTGSARHRARTSTGAPTGWLRTPCASETQVPPARSKWITLSEPLISLISTGPLHRARRAPPAGRTWCGRSATVIGAVGVASAAPAARSSARPSPSTIWPSRLVAGGDVDRRVGEHACAGQVARLAIDRDRRPELRDAALVQRGDVAAEQQRLARLGGGVDHGAAAVGEQARQLVAQRLAQLVVEVGQRLVEQHQVGILDQRARQRRALLLAARQLARACDRAARASLSSSAMRPTRALDLAPRARASRAAATRCSRTRSGSGS